MSKRDGMKGDRITTEKRLDRKNGGWRSRQINESLPVQSLLEVGASAVRSRWGAREYASHFTGEVDTRSRLAEFVALGGTGWYILEVPREMIQ